MLLALQSAYSAVNATISLAPANVTSTAIYGNVQVTTVMYTPGVTIQAILGAISTSTAIAPANVNAAAAPVSYLISVTLSAPAVQIASTYSSPTFTISEGPATCFVSAPLYGTPAGTTLLYGTFQDASGAPLPGVFALTTDLTMRLMLINGYFSALLTQGKLVTIRLDVPGLAYGSTILIAASNKLADYINW
jgi:hypothetical protein